MKSVIATAFAANSGIKNGLTELSGKLGDSGLEIKKSGVELIVGWTNFALSFVFVIAVAIVIAGGFIYLTSGVDEAAAGKSKKMIVGAIIGIIIILSAYAIVNTLLGVPAGTSSLR